MTERNEPYPNIPDGIGPDELIILKNPYTYAMEEPSKHDLISDLSAAPIDPDSFAAQLFPGEVQDTVQPRRIRRSYRRGRGSGATTLIFAAIIAAAAADGAEYIGSLDKSPAESAGTQISQRTETPPGSQTKAVPEAAPQQVESLANNTDVQSFAQRMAEKLGSQYNSDRSITKSEHRETSASGQDVVRREIRSYVPSGIEGFSHGTYAFSYDVSLGLDGKPNQQDVTSISIIAGVHNEDEPGKCAYKFHLDKNVGEPENPDDDFWSVRTVQCDPEFKDNTYTNAQDAAGQDRLTQVIFTSLSSQAKEVHVDSQMNIPVTYIQPKIN